jgi:hypothetical protein
MPHSCKRLEGRRTPTTRCKSTLELHVSGVPRGADVKMLMLMSTVRALRQASQLEIRVCGDLGFLGSPRTQTNL